jgi:hypothetical protein
MPMRDWYLPLICCRDGRAKSVYVSHAIHITKTYFMANKPCRCNHIRRHSVTDEEDNVLGLALFSQVANEPSGFRLTAIVVVESSDVLARFVKGNAAVPFCGNVDEGWLLRVPCEKVFVPCEIPLFQFGFFEVEEFGYRL